VEPKEVFAPIGTHCPRLSSAISEIYLCDRRERRGRAPLGINIFEVKVLVYILAGAIAGLAGITHPSVVRAANPFDIVGTELNVIAAVVLGDARVGAAMAGSAARSPESPLRSSTIR
jgi:hypothetical protein